MYCGHMARPTAKLNIDSLKELRKSHIAYRESIGIKMNDFNLFRGRLWSCQPLRQIRRWISRKPLEIEVVPGTAAAVKASDRNQPLS